MSGCVSTNLTGEVAADVDLSAITSFHVVKLDADERGIEKVIAEELGKRGFEVSSGLATDAPAGADAMVTYQDSWMWDITMYMLEINIQFRDAESEVILASGSSYRTSLARKEPAFMINEVLTEIFGE